MSYNTAADTLLGRAALLGIFTLAGCSSQPTAIVESQRAEIVSPRNIDHADFATSLEVDLLLGLWLHLGNEQSKLQQRFHSCQDSSQQKILHVFIEDIQAERQQVFKEIFRDD